MRLTFLAAWALLCSVVTLISLRADEPLRVSQVEIIPHPTTVIEARARARLLHESIRGALQVVHRDFFDEDDAHAIPSASLQDVFHEMSRSYQRVSNEYVFRS